MELTFNNNDSVYVSEFKVDSDFNLHVERDELGKFIIWVKTTPVGNYAKVNHEENLDDLYVIDYNFTGTVYPKYIKIVSKVEPTYAAITTDGEVTEIKTQSKEIEITSNGTTNITPDSGFTYLDSVKVMVDVPTEGGGSGVEANDLFYYMNNTADNPQFYIDLKTGELVSATSWFEDEEFRNGYYSIDGDTISVRHPGNNFSYGIGTLTSVVADSEEIEVLSGVVREVQSWQEELSVTKIGNWNFKLLE